MPEQNEQEQGLLASILQAISTKGRQVGGAIQGGVQSVQDLDQAATSAMIQAGLQNTMTAPYARGLQKLGNPLQALAGLNPGGPLQGVGAAFTPGPTGPSPELLAQEQQRIDLVDQGITQQQAVPEAAPDTAVADAQTAAQAASQALMVQNLQESINQLREPPPDAIAPDFSATRAALTAARPTAPQDDTFGDRLPSLLGAGAAGAVRGMQLAPRYGIGAQIGAIGAAMAAASSEMTENERERWTVYEKAEQASDLALASFEQAVAIGDAQMQNAAAQAGYAADREALKAEIELGKIYAFPKIHVSSGLSVLKLFTSPDGTTRTELQTSLQDESQELLNRRNAAVTLSGGKLPANKDHWTLANFKRVGGPVTGTMEFVAHRLATTRGAGVDGGLKKYLEFREIAENELETGSIAAQMLTDLGDREEHIEKRISASYQEYFGQNPNMAVGWLENSGTWERK